MAAIDETAGTEPLDLFELVGRLAHVRLAFDEHDPATAARLTAELHDELVSALLSTGSPAGEGNHQGGALVGREGCLNGQEDLADAVRDPRYDGFEATMHGPTQFSLLVAGELEMQGPLLVGFNHSPCNDSERARLLQWLATTTELGQLLSTVLDRL